MVLMLMKRGIDVVIGVDRGVVTVVFVYIEVW